MFTTKMVRRVTKNSKRVLLRRSRIVNYTGSIKTAASDAYRFLGK